MAKFGFKSNTAEMRQWLLKRKASLENARLNVEPIWNDIRDYFEPRLGRSLLGIDPDQASAERGDEKIYNTEPRILLHRMGAGLQSGITNQARQWFKFQPTDKQLAKQAAIRKWLDTATETVQGVMARSNVYPALDQIYLHLGAFGTSAAIVVADDENTGHVYVLDEGSYWLAENRRGRVDQLLRRIPMTVENMVSEFGEGWLPDRIMQRYKDGKLEERFTVYHLICPNGERFQSDIPGQRPFVGVYWLDGEQATENGSILALRSYAYNPIIAPRWWITGSVYGSGCGELGLADSKQLQALELDKLKLVEQEVNPAMAAPGSMKGIPIDTGPGGVNYEPDNIGGRGGNAAIRRLFETREQLQAVLLAIDATQQRLGRIFNSDLFAMMLNLNMAPKQMTAREVSELSGEKVALLGPILTRLNTDLLDPLVNAVFALCLERGELGQVPDVLYDQPIKVEYVSSLHVEQQSSTRMSGLFRLAEFVGGIAQFQPNVVDKIDFDEMVDVAAVSLTEHGVVRDDSDVAAIRQARAAQEQAMQQAEAISRTAPALSRAAKDLSETRTGTGSALDALTGAAAPGGAQ